MSKVNEYYLIKKELTTDDIEYFDFEQMEFSSEKKKGVYLATIDALTTIFTDKEEMENYFDIPIQETANHYKIIYRSKNKNKDKELNVVWDDPILSGFSKLTDGKVDYTGNTQYETLMEMLNELRDVKTGFGMRLSKSKKEEHKLSDHAKSVVIAASSDNSNSFTGDFIKTFSSYKDCRALYLAYKEHKEMPSKIKVFFQKMKRI